MAEISPAALSASPIDQYLFSEIVSKKLTRRNWLAWKVQVFFLLNGIPGAEQILLSDKPNDDIRLDHQLAVALLSCAETDGVDSVLHIVLTELAAGRNSARAIFKALEEEMDTPLDSFGVRLFERVNLLQLYGDDVHTLLHEMDKIWLDARLMGGNHILDDTFKMQTLQLKCKGHPEYSITIDAISSHFTLAGHSHGEIVKRMEFCLRRNQDDYDSRKSQQAPLKKNSNGAARSVGPKPSAPTQAGVRQASQSCDNCGRHNHVTSQCRTRSSRAN